MTEIHITGSGIDVDETCLEGLLHVFCNILRPHGRQVIDMATRVTRSLWAYSSLPFGSGSERKCRELWLLIRDGMRERWGETDLGSVVEDHRVEGHSKEEMRTEWRRRHPQPI